MKRIDHASAGAAGSEGRRGPAGRSIACPGCGHDLRDRATIRCPECGEISRLAPTSERAPGTWWLAGVLGTSVGLAGALVQLGWRLAELDDAPLRAMVRGGFAPGPSRALHTMIWMNTAAAIAMILALAWFVSGRRRLVSLTPGRRMMTGVLGLGAAALPAALALVRWTLRN